MNSALIIDGNPTHTEVSRTLLSFAGISEISSTKDCATAKSLLSDRGPFDLVLLDLNMPDYDGVEFLDHLRDINCRAAIVIASAAHTTIRTAAEELAKAYGLHVAGALEKPITLQKLSPALARV